MHQHGCISEPLPLRSSLLLIVCFLLQGEDGDLNCAPGLVCHRMPYHHAILQQTDLPYEAHVPREMQDLPERPNPGVENQDPVVVSIRNKQSI